MVSEKNKIDITRKKRGPRFGQVYEHVMRNPKLTKGARLVYVALTISTDRQSNTSKRTGLRTIAEIAGLSLSHINEHIAELEKQGIVQVIKGDRKTPNQYILLDEEQAIEELEQKAYEAGRLSAELDPEPMKEPEKTELQPELPVTAMETPNHEGVPARGTGCTRQGHTGVPATGTIHNVHNIIINNNSQEILKRIEAVLKLGSLPKYHANEFLPGMVKWITEGKQLSEKQQLKLTEIFEAYPISEPVTYEKCEVCGHTYYGHICGSCECSESMTDKEILAHIAKYQTHFQDSSLPNYNMKEEYWLKWKDKLIQEGLYLTAEQIKKQDESAILEFSKLKEKLLLKVAQ